MTIADLLCELIQQCFPNKSPDQIRAIVERELDERAKKLIEQRIKDESVSKAA